MPEAPDLEIIKDYLNDRIQGLSVESAKVLRPTVLRSLAGNLVDDIAGRKLGEVQRRGKFLLFSLSGGRWLVINPMLTGAVQLCPGKLRVLKKTCFIIDLPEGQQIRYLDDRQMGKVYYISVEQMDQVPALAKQGPDVLAGISF